MSKATTKTDHSHLQQKLELRLQMLSKQKNITVLDCYAGQGLIWQTIQTLRPDTNIDVTGIELKSITNKIHLKGDNLKFLPIMDLSRFDVIDMDAYSSPLKQLKIILSKQLKKQVVIFITIIQSGITGMPRRLLYDLEYTKAMVAKSPALFCHNTLKMWLAWLAVNGVKELTYWHPAYTSHIIYGGFRLP